MKDNKIQKNIFLIKFLIIFVTTFCIFNPSFFNIKNYSVHASTSTSPEPFINTADYFDSIQDLNESLAIPEERTPNPFPTSTQQSGTSSSSTDAFFDCTVGGILTNVITGAISGLVQKGLGAVSGLVGAKVKVSNPQDDAKDKGVSLDLFGISIPIVPSWDSFAYCLVNKTIAYLSEATKQWIRSGFNGNPAFVDDPAGFFTQVADFEYENFLNDIAGELLCEPFKLQVINKIHQNYNKSYLGNNGYGRCTLGDGDNVQAFLNGEYFDFDVWMEYTQNPANNPLGSAILAEDELNRRISVAQNTATIELDWGNGYFSWKDEETGKTITPGQVVETEIAERFGLDEERLILADEFDELITELVNYLVRTAIDETFSGSNGRF